MCIGEAYGPDARSSTPFASISLIFWRARFAYFGATLRALAKHGLPLVGMWCSNGCLQGWLKWMSSVTEGNSDKTFQKRGSETVTCETALQPIWSSVHERVNSNWTAEYDAFRQTFIDIAWTNLSKRSWWETFPPKWYTQQAKMQCFTIYDKLDTNWGNRPR